MGRKQTQDKGLFLKTLVKNNSLVPDVHVIQKSGTAGPGHYEEETYLFY